MASTLSENPISEPGLMRQALDWVRNIDLPSGAQASRVAFLAFLAALVVDQAALAQDDPDQDGTEEADDDDSTPENPFQTGGKNPFNTGTAGDSPFQTGGENPFNIGAGESPFQTTGENPFVGLEPVEPPTPAPPPRVEPVEPTPGPKKPEPPTPAPILPSSERKIDPKSVRPGESGFSDDQLAALYDLAVPSVVRLQMQHESGKYFSCSGYFFEEPGIVATARHCVDNQTEDDAGNMTTDNLKIMWVEWPLEMNEHGEITKVAMAAGWPVGHALNHDTAFVVVPPGIEVPTPLQRNGQIRRTTSVAAIGHPRGTAWMISPGRVASVVDGQITTTTSTDKGNSGGPILDQHGRVVSTLAYGDHSSPNGHSYSIPIGITYELMQGFMADGQFQDAQATLTGQPLWECPVHQSVQDGVATGYSYEVEMTCSARARRSIPAMVWESVTR